MKRELFVYTGNDELAPYNFKIQSSVLGTFNPTVYGQLLESNDNQELKPGLIRSWKYDFKSKKYLLTLGAYKFHNGREIEAEDLEFSIVRGFISNSENYNRIHFSDIKGISDLTPGMKFKSGMVAGMKVIDKKTLEIELANQNPVFLLNFTIPFVPLVPQEELKEDYFTWKKWPIGAGPYKIESDYADHRIKLVAVHATQNAPDTIVIDTARKEKKYDIIYSEVVPSSEEGNFERVLSKYPTSINSFKFYRTNEINMNLNFRKAIYHAIDRDALASGLSLEQFRPAYEMMVRPYGGRVKAKNPYDLELAKSYAEKLPKEYFSKEIVIGIYAAPGPFDQITLERNRRLTDQLAKIGFKVRFEPNVEKFPTPEVMKKFTIGMSSKVVDLADPAISYGALSSRSPYHNENPAEGGEFDQAYENVLEANDSEVRFQKIQDLAKLIETKALTVPILEKYALYRINPDKVKTLGDQYKPLFMDLSKVEMN